uniref:Uncharacterized protein n=1 Tax=Chenopodium quinoa TaxID=63459 RepID=A0A803N6Q7_CHEQI
MAVGEDEGAEIKSGGSLKVCIGEIKKDKGNDYIRLYVHKNGQKFIAGMLSLERIPQVTLDLIFEDEFDLSHDLKQGKDDLEELVPIEALNNGKPEANDLKPSRSKPNAGLKFEKAEGIIALKKKEWRKERMEKKGEKRWRRGNELRKVEAIRVLFF